MLIIKGDTVLDVTPKAYEVIYKDHDFTIKEEKTEAPQQEPEEKPAEPIKQKALAKKGKAKAGEE